MIQPKNRAIETLRGAAILLVVMGHVIGSAPDGGMKIDFPSGWRYFYLCIVYIQMPLFTAIAGWVYALKPTEGVFWGRFVGTKFKRLLIPMAAVSTLYFLVQYLTPGTNSKELLGDIWQIYVFPYTIFWYLQALFLIFMVAMTIDRCGGMRTYGRWLLTLSICFALYVIQVTIIPYEVPNLFAFKGALDQLPYFITGIGIQRFGARLYPKFLPFYILSALTGIVLLQTEWFWPYIPPETYRSLLPLWLIPTLLILFNIGWQNKFFVYLGTYAYSIYLFHGFGTAGGRICLSYLGVDNRIIIFTIAMTIALFVPIAIDKLLSGNRLFRMLFLGKPYNNKK